MFFHDMNNFWLTKDDINDNQEDDLKVDNAKQNVACVFEKKPCRLSRTEEVVPIFKYPSSCQSSFVQMRFDGDPP